MSEHTPEPWRAGRYDYSDVVECQSNNILLSKSEELDHATGIANASRIVACVNACAGMADPAAEIARLRADNDEIDEVCTKRQLKIYELEAEIAKLRAEREELRSVAKEMAEQVALLPANDGRILGLLPVLCRLRAALAEKD